MDQTTAQHIREAARVTLVGYDEETLKVGHVECYLEKKEDWHYLSFRGTENTSEWIRNFKFRKADYGVGQVHRGFLESWLSISNRVSELLSNEGVNTDKLVISGHSAGAGLAGMATLELKPKYLFTFGSPRWCCAKNRDHILKYTKAVRFVNCIDPVVWVPLFNLGYAHVGELVYADRFGVPNLNSALIGRLVDMVFRYLKGAKLTIRFDHDMSHYVNIAIRLAQQLGVD